MLLGLILILMPSFLEIQSLRVLPTDLSHLPIVFHQEEEEVPKLNQVMVQVTPQILQVHLAHQAHPMHHLHILRLLLHPVPQALHPQWVHQILIQVEVHQTIPTRKTLLILEALHQAQIVETFLLNQIK